MEESISLDKERLLSEIVDDSYRYIKQNFAQMVRRLIVYAGPFLVVSGAFTQKLSVAAQQYDGNPEGGTSGVVLLDLFIQFAVQSLTLSIVYGYILAKEQKIEYTNDVMWDFIKVHFFQILSSLSSVVVLVILGAIAFILPAIYIIVPLSMIYIHRIKTGDGFIPALQQLFSLVKNQWWNTFGLFLISGLILGICGAVFLIPSFFAGYSIENTTVQGLLISSFGTAMLHIITSLFAVPVVMQYYNLKRKMQ